MIKPVVVGLLVCLPLSMSGLDRICAAQDEGPLLPGFESSASEEPTPASEPPSEPTDPPLPVDSLPSSGGVIDDGIAPLDADGIPQSGPSDEPAPEPQLVLPDPPALEPVPAVDPPQEAPRKKNLWQKSTEKIRTLTNPEPKADEPVKDKSPAPNWQLLRRSQPEAGKAEPKQLNRSVPNMNPGVPNASPSSKNAQAERARQQQLQLQQQRLQQQRLEQQRQQQQRLQMQQQRQQHQNPPEAPQSRWQSQESPQQTYRSQPTQKPGSVPNQVRSGQTSSSRRQVQGAPRPQYQPQTQVPRPQQGQKQRRTVDPRSAENSPHAPWDMQPAPSKPNVATRPANVRSRSATQTVRSPQASAVPR